MSLKSATILTGLVVAVFFGFFVWAYAGSSRSNIPASATVNVEGRYGTYFYTVTTVVGRKERTVIFNPQLKNDDVVVVGALRELVRSTYGDSLIDGIQPTVESHNEKNYITLSSFGGKTYFQLFKDESGEVGSVRFWRESIEL